MSNELLDITNFIKALQDLVDLFKNMDEFHAEAAQLSRLIFMNCKQFRMMKGLSEMKKAHQSLLRYLNLDIVTAVETFKGFIFDDAGSNVTVPYQQSLDYILIRLQGLSKLLIRVVDCSRRSASFFLGLIKAGSFYTRGVVFLSTLASVWSRSREICKSVVAHYNKLRQFRELLKKKPGLKWAEQEYELPDALEHWLVDDYERFIINPTYDVRLLVKDTDIEYFLLNKVDMCDPLSRIQAVDSSIKTEQDDSMTIDSSNQELELEDFTPIARTFKKETEVVETLDHSTSFCSKDSIATFIKNETLYRKVDPMKSLTINKMKKKTWKEFKEDMKNKLVLMQENAFINYVNDYLNEYKV